MKRYKAVFDDQAEESGVYAIAVVDNPAMQDSWIRLKSDDVHEISFDAVDDEKQILLGAVLIPNKDILRRDPIGEPFYIYFDEPTIERAAHEFIKNGMQGNSTTNHETKLEGVSVVQSWIVEDSEKDKSTHYGKTYPVGTWVAMMKVDDKQTWQDAKDGKLNGFSIEALFGLKEIKLNSNTMADKKKLFEQFLALFNNENDVKLGQLKLKDGKTTLEFEGEQPEVGMPIFVLSENGEEKIPAPEGKHELENGEYVFVDANGLVSAPVKEEEKDQEEEVKMMALAAQKAVKGAVDQVRKEFDTKLSEAQQRHKADMEAKDKKIEELEAKLKEEPASTGIIKTELTFSEPKTRKQRMLNLASRVINQN